MRLLLEFRKEGEPGEVKRLSTWRKRNQLRCRYYQRENTAEGKPNACMKVQVDVVLQDSLLVLLRGHEFFWNVEPKRVTVP